MNFKDGKNRKDRKMKASKNKQLEKIKFFKREVAMLSSHTGLLLNLYGQIHLDFAQSVYGNRYEQELKDGPMQDYEQWFKKKLKELEADLQQMAEYEIYYTVQLHLLE